MMNEKLISSHMEKLGLTREEAIKLIEDDNAVDRMKSTKEINSDITTEQQKVIKEATISKTKKTTAYNFTKRERKKDSAKVELIQAINDFLNTYGCGNVMIVKEEREVSFTMDNGSYSITLTKHRDAK